MIRKFFFALVGFAAIASLTGCKMDEQKTTWDEYADWREVNDNWLREQAQRKGPDGKPLYTKVTPAWNSNAYVLMRWLNDTTLTRDNLRPLYTSTVDVKYYGQLYNDEPFDSTYMSTNPADSVRRLQLSNTIQGWVIAMERMHVGDSVDLIIPYPWGYGASTTTSIKPYSTLHFQIKLVDVAGEYIRP